MLYLFPTIEKTTFGRILTVIDSSSPLNLPTVFFANVALDVNIYRTLIDGAVVIGRVTAALPERIDCEI